MKGGRAATLWLAALACASSAAATPAPAPSGVVVEAVGEGSEGEKAGIRPGDILIAWKRPPNPPANPAGASGIFRTPFDVLRVNTEDAQRADTLTLELKRDGARLSASVSPYDWLIDTRPAFSGRRLALYDEGRRLVESGEREEGCARWRDLADALAAAGDRVESAWVWRTIGRQRASSGPIDEGTKALDRAIAQARAAGRVDVEARLLWDQAEIYALARRFEDGVRPLRDALTILEREDPGSLAVANALIMMNLVTEPRGAIYESQQKRALRILEKQAPGSAAEANVLSSLSTVTAWRGDARAGAEFQRRSLATYQRLNPGDWHVPVEMNGLCTLELLRGDFAAAEQHCRRVLDLTRRLPSLGQPGLMSARATSAAYHNLALIEQSRGDLDRAAGLLQQALTTREKTEPRSRGVAVHLQALGVVEMRRGNLAEAEALLRRADEIQNEVAQLNSPHRAGSQEFMAEIAYRRGDLPAAIERLREAAAFWQPLAPDGPSAAGIYNDLGRVLAENGVAKEAESQLRHALAIRRRSAPGSLLTAESEHNLGMLLWKVGRLPEAEVELRRAVDDLEAQLATLGGTEEARSIFAAEFADYYRDYLRLLVELRRHDDAFLLLERYRAGSFLRTLAQRDLGAPVEVPPDLESERRSVNAEYERVQQEIARLKPSSQAKELDEALGRLEGLRRRQSEIADAIRKASPRYAELRYPKPLDLAGARAALEPGTLLLSYAVGRSTAYLFVVSPASSPGGGLAVFELPIGEKELRESVEAFRRLIARGETRPELASSSRALYDALLRPAEPLVAGSDRLLVLPDGPLHRLPWAALSRTDSRVGRPYLAEWKPVSTAASATVYAELKKERRSGPRDPAVLLAAFGDPQYPALPERRVASLRSAGDANDAGIPGDGTGDPDEPEDPQLRAVVRGGFEFAPLPASRAEVRDIAALYAPRAETYLGAAATEDQARAIGRDVPLVHYACHAVLNGRFPLDSALVFTIPEKPARGRENGLLQAWEIFETMRLDADLVTLSACESGLGKEVGGEGLVGLTRAFQFAGARSVLASLWKVEDKSTAELMRRFYGYLKTGQPKDEALRLAQVDLLRSTEFAPPRAWAAFQLDGDWK